MPKSTHEFWVRWKWLSLGRLINMDGLVIRMASPEDTDWAIQLLLGSEPWTTLGATEEQFLKIFRDPQYLTFVAHLNGIPCGLLILHPRGLASSPYVKTVAVTPETRSRGIGAALMQFAENHFRSESKHIFLCVSSFNERAKVFYHNLGYHIVGELKDYIIEGESEILMHKLLK